MIPQAYTARDIGEAYKWIQTLPPHVREELKTMEQMVLNYLRAKSMGTLDKFQPDAQTKKSHDFQKTLQNLRAEMEQFDPPEVVPQAQPHYEATQPVNPNVFPQAQQQQQGQAMQVQVQMQSQQAQQQTPSPAQLLNSLKLDPKSRQILNEIRDGLNLSSDAEVIRMCLVVAYKTIKNLIE